MEKQKKRAQERGNAKNATNFFTYYSGHGSSLNGKLHITLPTVFRKEEFCTLKDDLPEIMPEEELSKLILNYKRQQELLGVDFDKQKMELKSF